jgi:phosphatidate cytidylyltransferase
MLTRIATAVLAGSVALAAILWREPWGVLALLVVVFVLAFTELDRMGYLPLGAIVFASLPVLATMNLKELALEVVVIANGAFWALGVLGLIVRNPKHTAGSWVGVGVVSAFWLKQESGQGWGAFSPSLLLLALLPLWVGDSLAYFVGKAFGKHKMAPGISPNKTWEGAVANLLGCLGAAYGIGAWLGVPVVASLAVGLTTGVLGQVGDLLQSRLKRLANVKDSGSILPGHGGILDRLDSFLFSSYPSLLALYLLAPEAFHVKQWPW